MILTLIDEEGNERVLPTRWEICDRCRGDGHHGNPAFDGLSADDEFWHDDDPYEDFKGDYMAGRYDVPCYECSGSGKVRTVDEERMSPEDVKLWEEAQYEEAEYESIRRMEMRMGA